MKDHNTHNGDYSKKKEKKKKKSCRKISCHFRTLLYFYLLDQPENTVCLFLSLATEVTFEIFNILTFEI